MAKIEIFVITPDATESEKYKFHGHGDMVVLRCITGDMGILPGRIAFSAILGEGIMRVKDDDGTERKIAVLGGVTHFEDDILTVISQKALLPGDIDITATQADVNEFETRLGSDAPMAEKDRIRGQLRRGKILLDAAAV